MERWQTWVQIEQLNVLSTNFQTKYPRNQNNRLVCFFHQDPKYSPSRAIVLKKAHEKKHIHAIPIHYISLFLFTLCH